MWSGNLAVQVINSKKCSEVEEDHADPVTVGRRLLGLFPMATNNRRENDTAIP
jgi:hypothetical protein